MSEERIVEILKGAPFRLACGRIANLMATERDRWSFYLVQVIGVLLPDDPRFILLDQEYCLLSWDSWVEVRDWEMVATIGRLRPSRIVPMRLRSTIDAMWASALPVRLKKFLVNKQIGLCGKWRKASLTLWSFTTTMRQGII